MRGIKNVICTHPAALTTARVIAVFDVNPSAWDEGRIRYTCSLCRATDDAGPTRNPAVHGEMREHLKRHHGIRGTSVLRSETFMDDRGAISTIEFFRA
jgi:hypothetical protein